RTGVVQRDRRYTAQCATPDDGDHYGDLEQRRPWWTVYNLRPAFPNTPRSIVESWRAAGGVSVGDRGGKLRGPARNAPLPRRGWESTAAGKNSCVDRRRQKSSELAGSSSAVQFING